MYKFFCACFILVGFCGCQSEKKNRNVLKTGTWRGVIEIQGKELPFNFETVKDTQGGYDIFIRNAEEKLMLDEVRVSEDSLDILLHIFDASIKSAIDGDTLRGEFIKHYEKNYRLPFRAVYGQTHRFEKGTNQSDIPDFNGRYEVQFLNDSTKAIGIFTQTGDSVTGTFLTETGDYRYLQGNVADSIMQLSTFDGNYAYLFTAVKESENTLRGDYYSGKTVHDTWVAIRNEAATLADPESLTFLKPGYDKIEFSFPDVNGDTISLADTKYTGKVVVLQLTGSWCPNCMDETRFLSSWYDQNKHRGVEIIGLAYERKDDFNYASSRVKKMIDKLDVNYDVVIAGTNDKISTAKTLPQLNEIAAFPTTIFIGKDGKVKKIHTGFSGPATGKHYEQFVQRFNKIINELLQNN